MSMKRLFRYMAFAAAVIIAAAGCNKPESGSKTPTPTPTPTPAKDSKTVIAYFFGTSLSYYFGGNISAMNRAVGENFMAENQRLLLFYQRNSTTAEIQEIRYDSKNRTTETTVLETVSLDRVLDAQTFAANLKKVMAYAPADSYSLILLGHSTAWLPKTPAVSTYRLGGYRPSLAPMEGAEITRHLGEKSTDLDIDELAEGLAATGVKFDCLYFDVCFMSSLESAYALRNTTGYIIGSPCEIMGYGSPYDKILKPLFANDYRSVCEEFYKFYTSYDYPSGCIATIDCSKLEAVAAAAKRINAAATAAAFNIQNVQSYEGRSDHWFFDAGDYYSQICSDAQLAAAFGESLDKCVINRYHTQSYYSAYNSKMNAVDFYSGINITPDEKCIEAIVARLGEMDGKGSAYSALEAQKQILEYYNQSLKQTAWYKATH